MNYIQIIILTTFCTLIVTGEPESPSTCTTPLGEQGICVPLRQCPKLKQAYCNGVESAQMYIEALACKSGNFSVCCVTATTQTTQTTVKPTTQTTAKPTTTKKPLQFKVKTQINMKKFETKLANNKNRKLLPNKRYCGMQHTDDYVYEGNETAVDEFPWLVEVECIYSEEDSTTKFPGVVLSNRYILTTEKCDKNGKTVVTLGKYKRHESVSCVLTRFNEERDCSEPEQKLTATESLTYPTETFVLLRLEKKISFTDYIRPICLPFERRDKPRVRNKVVSSGWGTTDGVEGQAEVKKKIFYDVIDDDECWEENSKTQLLCAKRTTVQEYSLCKGDKGSPVMFKRRLNWFIIGVLGDPQCQSKRPIVTKLIDEDVLNWILNSVLA
ncbi:hypothetical protein ILUMI_00815 [Ignelater luminosus]|uniref:CLIP domain-containing serine protease n=1 Tax=Ignelater luminosus TaxID=2038154 RepID=A0A8K0DJH4_IGNLU|nr:hypothetical protein ILUMI_00815 [Ignelater luminosus]